MLIRLENKEDVQSLVRELSVYAEDRIVDVDYVYNTKETIRAGLWPYPYAYESWMSDWLEGRMSDEDVAFWWRLGDASEVGDFSKYKKWIYRPIETWKRMALNSALSIGLILYAPDMLYKVSRRPKTDMSIFRTPDSLLTSRKFIVDGRLIIGGQEWNVIPVTRYAQGMSKGLYYEEERAPDICGTFYYYEPESTTYLAYKSELRAFNKTEACKLLGMLKEVSGRIPHFNIVSVLRHSRGTLPSDLIMTPSEAVAARSRAEDPAMEGTSNDVHYAGGYLGLHALEDWLDQPLCNTASQSGYDVVVLENMVGGYQVVTEVLDTRCRENSFGSLVYVVD